MNKTMKCFRFQMNFMKRPSIIFTCIYLAFSLIVALLLMPVSKDTKMSNMNIGSAAFIFLFVCYCASFTNVFNTLLIFGNTRKSILNSFYLIAAAYSGIFAVLSILTDYLSLGLSHLMGFEYVDSMVKIYGSSNDFEKLLWFFGLLFIFSALGLLYGALTYKFGKVFVISFWCFIGISMFIFVPVLSSLAVSNPHVISFFAAIFRWYFGTGYPFGMLLAALNFTVTGVVVCAVTYLIARRQPQNV